MRLFDHSCFFLCYLQAAQQQKFREIQEVERRKRFEEQRARDHDKFVQVEERRRVSFYPFSFFVSFCFNVFMLISTFSQKNYRLILSQFFFVNFQAIESAERERRGALLKKNQEREGKIFAKKKALNNQTYFAFGSCTPRMGYSISGMLLDLAFSSF